MSGERPLLRVSGIETAYPDGRVALSGASLEVHEGGVVAVLGPNGAGKTTLLRTIAGLVRGQPRTGTLELGDRRIDGLDAERVARHGVVFVPEDRGLFRELSVGENLDLALWGRRRREGRDDLERVRALFPVLRERSAQQAETLSGGEQQMLALARALLRRPRLLLLDEPSLGLAPAVARAVFAALREIAARGTAMVVVEQNAPLALALAGEALVLDAGRVVTRGPAHELAKRQDVRSAGLGLGSAPEPPLEGRIPDERRR